jgi:SagB-type dehydrogenase family enzyme
VTQRGVNADVHAYHDGTKHQFHRFARSLGYLDWASQPNPFRSFHGAPIVPLSPRPDAAPSTIGEVLRYALGLSAWKRLATAPPGSQPAAGTKRWALRVNPSSGNLHPTEAYVISGAMPGLGKAAAVYHYAADRHLLERRCVFDSAAWPPADANSDPFLVALTSIHWREAWKYGERAFRYCQHDIGHAIAAVRIAASLGGCTALLLPDWSHGDIATVTGIDRDEDYVEAEREEGGCVLVISRQSSGATLDPSALRRDKLLAAVRAGQWTGKASQLSEDHTTWSFIDEIAAATRDPGHHVAADPAHPADPARPADPAHPALPADPAHVILQRRSAVAFDGASSLSRAAFFAMLSTVMAGPEPPWDALWWTPRIHLAIFVHRVDEVAPGLYLLLRDQSAGERLRAACGRDFAWEPAHHRLPLFLLAAGDGRAIARRLSCDQDIAADGFFSLAMVAEFDGSLQTFGASFYRHLFWEAGFVGQVLYLAAEAAGARATGIGCFFDDPVHDLLGIADHRFQDLYHFTVGVPVEDTRLTTEPGYAWELGQA